jgi:Rps23 Pro-64 3,4-dihydroxylase Tpa1-like proline 4-hydroxylase
MIDILEFREQGFIYDDIRNYSDLINFEDIKIIKNKIDLIPFKRYSKYDYWFMYKGSSYIEQIFYENYLKRDKDLESADYVYNLAHRFQIDKMSSENIYPTWVFGTSQDDNIISTINDNILKEFQKKFVEKYYSEKIRKDEPLIGNFNLQFYDKGCEIKLHDDGRQENRLCVFLYFLNDEWNEENGGHLVLHTKDGNSIKVNPVFPNFVVLDTDINLFHEVELVKKETKYNIVSFYGYN